MTITDPYRAFSFMWPVAMPDKTADIPRYHHWFQRNDFWRPSAEIPYYPDLNSASDWWKEISNAALPIRSTNQIWEATRHQYGIFALVSQTPASFRRESSGGVGGNVGCFHRLQIYWNKSQVQLPQDRFGTLKSPSFDCFEIQKGGRDVM